MRAVIQRVTSASVSIGGEMVSRIGNGLLILLGITHCDTTQQADFLAQKCAQLRIFADDQGKLNHSVVQAGGEVLVVSQFTLYADCSKGRRPSFIDAAPQPVSEPLYLHFTDLLRQQGLTVQTGRFGADMQISLVNDGPVTIVLDTETIKKKGMP